MTLEKGIHYVGVNDYEIKLFEGVLGKLKIHIIGE